MQSLQRHNRILELVKLKGTVSVEELSHALPVSVQTIRSDLRELHDARKIIRVHGGARSIDGRENLEYESRRQIAAAEKIAIGAAGAKLIPANSSLFVNIGTTTEAVCDALSNHKNMLVITNNINVANNLRLNPEMEVVIAGGSVRTTDGAIVGEAAVDFIKQFKVDYAIIGSSAIDQDGALLDYDIREVKVAQAIIANARKVILVADSSKLNRAAPIRIAHMSQVDFFVTDKLPSKPLRSICEKEAIQLIETSQY